MNCLILAAGHGSRLKALGPSKPLVEVAGLPLIEHVVRSAAEGGATRFTVVTGNLAAQVEAVLEGLAQRLDRPIATVRLEDWDRPNGWSVVAGAEQIDGDYLLMMADHLFDAQNVRSLIAAGAGAGPRLPLRLAIDRKLDDDFVDLDDVTKVETGDEGAIISIGKHLERFDAFDTGLFLATPGLRDAILQAAAKGSVGSLSDGVQLLADKGQAMTTDVTGWWIDVDEPKSHQQAESHLARLAAEATRREPDGFPR